MAASPLASRAPKAPAAAFCVRGQRRSRRRRRFQRVGPRAPVPLRRHSATNSATQVLVSQMAATKSAPTPEEKHLELQAAKRMYAAYCAGSPPPAEPEVCTNEILKKTLGGPAEMVPFAKG